MASLEVNDVSKIKDNMITVSPAPSNTSSSVEESSQPRNVDISEKLQKVEDLKLYIKSKSDNFDDDEYENALDGEEYDGEDYDGHDYGHDDGQKDDVEADMGAITNEGYTEGIQVYYNPYGFNGGNYDDYARYMGKRMGKPMGKPPVPIDPDNKEKSPDKDEIKDLSLEDFDSSNNLNSRESLAKPPAQNKPKFEEGGDSEGGSPFSSLFNSIKGLFGGKKVDPVDGNRGPVRTDAFEESGGKSSCFGCF